MRFLRGGLVVAAIAAAFGLTVFHQGQAQPPGTDSFSICARSDVISPPAAGSCIPVSAANPLPVDASVSASISGFAPATTGTPITATTSGVTGTLPAGEVVVAFNTSTSIAAYCKLGASSTVGDIAIPPSSWFAYTVGVATQLTCITASSTAVVNMVGGAGLPTGAGGGGGGSGGASSSFAAAFPATGTAIGFTDGTNMTAGRVGAVANVAAATNFVNALGICQYLAAAPTLTDTRFNQCQMDINGNLKVNVQSAVGLAQGSTTSGQTGSLVMGAVTTSSPSYTTAQTSPISLDTLGNTRVAAGGGDPCQSKLATVLPFTIPTATTTNILTGTASQKIYVCYLYLQTGIANSIAVISGTTGATCGSNTAALVGGTTAATGLINAANSGQAFGNGGFTVLQTQTNNDDICIITNAAGPLSGVMKYVKN